MHVYIIVACSSVYCIVYPLQLLDTINQLQQVKALHKSQVRKSAPSTMAEPIALQIAAVVSEPFTKPSPNPFLTSDKFLSSQPSSDTHLTDELVYATGSNKRSNDNMNVISEIDPTSTLVEMNVEQTTNVIPSTIDNNR